MVKLGLITKLLKYITAILTVQYITSLIFKIITIIILVTTISSKYKQIYVMLLNLLDNNKCINKVYNKK